MSTHTWKGRVPRGGTGSEPFPRSRSARAGRGAIALSLFCGLAVPIVLAGPARADVSYDGFARANGLDVDISNASIPTGIDVQGVGPESEVHATSYGIQDASAQFPYTGSTVPGLPATVLSLYGLPTPPYPFIASSNQGDAPQTVSYPGLTLTAESSNNTTRSSGVAGTDAAGMTSSASVNESSDGTVTSTATSRIGSLNLGSLIQLSGVVTTATTKADPTTGALTRTSTTSIGHISVPDLVINIPATTPGTLFVPIPVPGVPNIPPVTLPTLPIPLGGTTLSDPDLGLTDGQFTITSPIDGKPTVEAIPAQPVLDALKAAGITVTYQAPQMLTTGIQSGTYTFSYTVPSLPQNNYFNGPTGFTQTTGLATATLTLSPDQSTSGFTAPSYSDPGTTASASSSGSSSPAATTGTVTGPAPTDAAVGASLADPGSEPVASSDGLGTPAQSPQVAAPAAGVPAQISLAGFKVGLDLGNLYLALVAIAIVGFVSATALRLMGVRFLWSS